MKVDFEYDINQIDICKGQEKISKLSFYTSGPERDRFMFFYSLLVGKEESQEGIKLNVKISI